MNLIGYKNNKIWQVLETKEIKKVGKAWKVLSTKTMKVNGIDHRLIQYKSITCLFFYDKIYSFNYWNNNSTEYKTIGDDEMVVENIDKVKRKTTYRIEKI